MVAETVRHGTRQREGAKAPAGIRDASHYAPQLESLRGVAILLVALFHADGMLLSMGQNVTIGVKVSPLAAFVHAGHTGVTLFFVLSAFLLSRPFLAEAAGGRRVSRRSFFARRALRILPLYWTVVIVSTLLRVWLGDAGLSQGIPYLFFFNSFSGGAEPMFPFSDVWWSLATEAQFYLALPLFTLLLLSRWGRWLFLALLVLYAGTYYALVTSGSDWMHSKLSISLFGRGHSFLIGIAAAWIYDRWGAQIRERCSQSRLARWGGADLVLLAVILCQGLLLREVAFLGFFDAEYSWSEWHILESFLWALLTLMLLVAPLRLGFLLSNRLLGTVGLLSYSMYLVHFPIIFYVLYRLGARNPEAYGGWTLTSFGAVMLCIGLSLALSALTYLAIERPVLKRKARIGG